MDIQEDKLDGPEIQALLALHLKDMRENSPPGSVHALDLSELAAPDVAVWSAWNGTTLLGCAALKALGPNRGELKSMRTAPAHVRQGVAGALLEHVLAVARSRGYVKISLETGGGPAFEPALAFYRRRGFQDGPAFGGYAATDFNRFLHLDL